MPAKPKPPFAGWIGAKFQLRTRSGYMTTLSGSHASIVTELRDLIPAWYAVATGPADAADADLARMLAAESAVLGIDLAGAKEVPHAR